MGNVIELSKHKPHTAGECKCINCQHIFPCVAPAGVMWVDCPNCGLKKATWKNPFAPPEGSLVYTCDCSENQLYNVLKKGIFCVNCGKLTRYEDIVD